jgi:hypothetical protein
MLHYAIRAAQDGSTYTNGTYVGFTQYINAFQRSEFWTTDTNSYHTMLSPTVYPWQVYAPPVGYIAPGVPCGGTIGLIGILGFDKWAMARIAALGIQPNQFVIFLLDNVYMYYVSPSNCCYLGYHSAFGNPLQTYGVAAYDNSGAFGPTITDAMILSHEVGEWVNDPTGVNPTPAWGHVGQVPGCQTNMEVGDPLTGTDLPTIAMPNGMTYHMQELAFFSWFYGGPSQGVGGMYSSNSTFATPSTLCQ